MKPTSLLHARGPFSPFLRRTAALLLLLGFVAAARAATYTWDSAGASPAAPASGSGTWDTATARWSDGTADQSWSNSGFDSAVFGNAASGNSYTVTVGTVSANGLTFNAGTSSGTDKYTLSGGTITFGGTAPSVSVNAFDNVTLSSTLAGSSGLTFTGSNSNASLLISGANTFTGGATVTGTGTGTGLGMNVTNALGLGSNAVTISNAEIIYNVGGTVANDFSLGAPSSSLTRGTLAGAGGTTFSGNITLTANTGLGSINGSGGTVFSGPISGAYNLYFDMGTAGNAIVLTGSNSYAATTINRGTLQIGNGGATGTLGTGAVNISAASADATRMAYLKFDRSDNITVANTITSGTSSFVGGVIQAGTGKVTLTGANTYIGTTAVNAGTLLVDGSIASATTVAGGATFGGSGTAAAITLNGGTLAPGDGAGTLAAASLAWNGGSALAFELGSVSDLLTLSGAMTKGTAGTFLFTFAQEAGFGAGTYTLVDFGSTTFSASDFSYSGLSGYTGSFMVNSGNLEFVVSAVPEASTWALLALGSGLALLRRPRQILARMTASR